MPKEMVYIEDQTRNEYRRVYLDVDMRADRLVGKLVQQFGLPRYNFSARRIEYWLERPDEEKRLGQGKRLPHHITLRKFGVVRGDLLQLVSPEGHRVKAFIQQILEEIEIEITDEVSGKLKRRVNEKAWEHIKEKFAEIEGTHTNDKRVQSVQEWVNSVKRIGEPIKVLEIFKTFVKIYKQSGSLVKVSIFLATTLIIIMATLQQPSLAEPPETHPPAISVVTESNERNNVSCTPIQIESQPFVEQMKFRWFQWFR